MEQKELVKYANPLNKMPLWNLTKNEAVILFTILSRLKNQGGQLIELDFQELNQHIDKNLSSGDTADYLKQILQKIGNVPIKIETETTISAFWIFQEFQIDKNQEKLAISITPRFFYFLNDFGKDNYFTTFELAEFSMLSTKSQILYRLLKQFKYTGVLYLEWNEFKELMGFGKYQTCDIMKNIDKCISELSETNLFNKKPIFSNISYEKEYHRRRGRPLKALSFRFMPETRKLETAETDRAENISRSTKKEILRTKQNKDKQIVENQEQKINHFTGRKINWCDAYIDIHFYSDNKLENCFDTCKILDLYEHDNNVVMTAKNQENLSTFQIKFENRNHFENWLNTVK